MTDSDPLAAVRAQFDVPDRLYLDGNSLGPISEPAAAALENTIEEWRRLGIRGWTDADPPWFAYGERLGDRLAPYLGADPDSCVVASGTTINIHTLIATFLRSTDGDSVLVNELDFPTDHYAIRAQLRNAGADPDQGLIVVESRDGRTIHPEDIEAQIRDHEPDIVFLPSVLYRSGQRFDLEHITEVAHDHGAVAGFDLAHSIGLIPHELDAADVDFAVWCSYKYLNAGPGAIAGLYVNDRHHDHTPALTGWWGNDDTTQFDMQPYYDPAGGAARYQISTIPVFSAAPLFGACDLLDEAGLETVWTHAQALTGYLIDRIDTELTDYGYAVGTPRAASDRGGHVAVEHEAAARISQALRNRGIVVDYRPPNVIRVCPNPMYITESDIDDAMATFRDVVETGAYHEFERPDSVS